MRLIRKLVRSLVLLTLLASAGLSLFIFLTPELPAPFQRSQGPTVNDVTRMNPIPVEREAHPTSVEAVQELVRTAPGPISIGGGRFSMGGQTASPGSLHIDMRGLNKTLEVDKAHKLLRVQAGATWRSIQEQIDPENLSLSIMQSYSNFTVGGSLSVNVHGRYIGAGPLVGSVEAIKVVLADGSLVEASRSNNREVFAGCIGGYGGLGVIVEATLRLADNAPLERVVEQVPVGLYRTFFADNIRNDPSVVFQNGDLLPTDYTEVYSVSFRKTKKTVTEAGRLQPVAPPPSLLDRSARFILMDVPYGMHLRKYLEPLRYRSDLVVWRNYEASYDVTELQPIVSDGSSFVLQEYFLPVDKVTTFADVLRNVLTTHNVAMANVSIRHALPDRDTIMSWARDEVFAFVLYYRQGTDPDSRREVGSWTRELMQASVDMGGTYYLPYQLQAPKELFLRAYPRAEELFALKARLDPTYKFRGALWDAYYRPNDTRHAAEYAFTHPTETRPEVQSFLTLPEWQLVYASEDLAEVATRHPQHTFSFFGAIRDFWMLYARTIKFTARFYTTNWGYHFMNVVIGLNTTVEYALKGVYENTIGRATSWAARGAIPEGSVDHFIATTYSDYARFIHTKAWYQYPFFTRLHELWRIGLAHEASAVRHVERLISFSVELIAKGALGKIFGIGTEAIYGAEQEMITVIGRGSEGSYAQSAPQFVRVAEFSPQALAFRLPRYEPFTAAVKKMAPLDAQGNLSLIEIAGNQRIAVTVKIPMDFHLSDSAFQPIHEEIVLGDPPRRRISLSVPVNRLLSFVNTVTDHNGEVVHVYDY